MGILLSSQLVVALALFLASYVRSEFKLSDPPAIPTSSNSPEDEPLPSKLSSGQYESVCVNMTKQELLANIESKLAKELNAIREETAQRIKSEFTLTVDTITSIVKKFAEISVTASQVALENLKKELRETKKDFATISQILTDKIKATEENLAVTSVNLEMTQNKLTRTEAIVEDLSAKLNATKKELAETKINTENLSAELKGMVLATSKNLETTATNLNTTRTELSNTNDAVADLTAKLNARTNEIVDIGKIPTSCEDLQRMGQKINGIFLVQGPKKMETLYCNFYSSGNSKQKLIGYADVKSAPVHFYVQRNSSFAEKDTPIPFDLEWVNEGNAMDLKSSKFTTQRSGIYFFSFTGLVAFPTSSSLVGLGISLYLNGSPIGFGWVEDFNTVDNQWSPLTLQSTLNLKSGDQIWLQIDTILSGVSLYDDSRHHTHFTGFMLEEEIVASL